MGQNWAVGFGTILLILILVALFVPRDFFRGIVSLFKKPHVIEIELLPIDHEQVRINAQYKTDREREQASLRQWRASLIPLNIRVLAGWTLLIDHRRQHPTPKFRPVKLQAIKYDQGGGLYLVGQCLNTKEKRHFGMDNIYGYADASSKQEFATFEEWAAHQGIEVDLKAQVERIEQREIERFRAEQEKD